MSLWVGALERCCGVEDHEGHDQDMNCIISNNGGTNDGMNGGFGMAFR